MTHTTEEALKAEIRRLRGLVEEAWGEGLNEALGRGHGHKFATFEESNAFEELGPEPTEEPSNGTH